MVGRRPAAPGRFRVAVAIAGRPGQVRIREIALELVGLTGLIDPERAGCRSPLKGIAAVKLELVTAVAAEIAVLVVPELAPRAVADKRRPNEGRHVVGRVEGGVVLVEIAIVVAPGVRAA